MNAGDQQDPNAIIIQIYHSYSGVDLQNLDATDSLSCASICIQIVIESYE